MCCCYVHFPALPCPALPFSRDIDMMPKPVHSPPLRHPVSHRAPSWVWKSIPTPTSFPCQLGCCRGAASQLHPNCTPHSYTLLFRRKDCPRAQRSQPPERTTSGKPPPAYSSPHLSSLPRPSVPATDSTSVPTPVTSLPSLAARHAQYSPSRTSA